VKECRRRVECRRPVGSRRPEERHREEVEVCRRAEVERIEIAFPAAALVAGPRSAPPTVVKRVLEVGKRSPALRVHSDRSPVSSPPVAACRNAGRTDRVCRPRYRRLGRTFCV